MAAIQQCFGIYTQVLSSFKGNSQQIIEKEIQKLWQFKFTLLSQIYCTTYFLIYIK